MCESTAMVLKEPSSQLASLHHARQMLAEARTGTAVNKARKRRRAQRGFSDRAET